MKRKLQALLLGVLVAVPLLASVPAQVSAVNVIDCTGALATTDVCAQSTTSSQNPVIHIISVAITIISIIIGVAAVIVIILAGLAMITSNGDAQSVAKARSNIIYALVGLIIAALAETIVAFVLNKL